MSVFKTRTRWRVKVSGRGVASSYVLKPRVGVARFEVIDDGKPVELKMSVSVTFIRWFLDITDRLSAFKRELFSSIYLSSLVAQTRYRIDLSPYGCWCRHPTVLPTHNFTTECSGICSWTASNSATTLKCVEMLKCIACLYTCDLFEGRLLLRYALPRLVNDSRGFLSENPFRDQDTMALKKWYFYKVRVSCKLQDDIVY